MKNNIYVVYGGKWDKENNNWLEIDKIAKTSLKNKDKAYTHADMLIEAFLKEKGYPIGFTISDWYVGSNPVYTSICDVTNKKGELVFSVEIMTVDVTNII